MRPIRNSAKAIIIRDGRLLANKMMTADGPWYDLPGGGQEPGETLPEALRRECREEAGVEVEVGGLRFVRDYISLNHEFAAEDAGLHMVAFFFTCTIAPVAEPALGPLPDGGPVSTQVGVEWLPIEELERFPLYPTALRPLIGDLTNPEHPVYLGDVN